MSVVTVADIETGRLDRFLNANFHPSKAEFLRQHGGWWHRGQENQWVVVNGAEILAYCSIIPTKIRIGGEATVAAWWVDLVVDARHRGRGLQTLLDEKIREAAPLIIGIPNALAAKIHRSHGWGVRENLEVRLLPLNPREIAGVRAGGGFRASLLRAAGFSSEPFGRWLRNRVGSFEPMLSRVANDPSADFMARVFDNHHPQSCVTTVRDASYLQWRYLNAPYRDQLVFVVGGDPLDPRGIVVLRVIDSGSSIVARILDLFGDIGDRDLVADMIRLASRSALERGAIQVTALSSDSELSAVLRRVGFIIRSRARFCWWGTHADRIGRTVSSTHHLVLGDSDNDEP